MGQMLATWTRGYYKELAMKLSQDVLRKLF